MSLEKKIGVGEFKAHCLRLFEEVRRGQRRYTITRHGLPIARVVPARLPRKARGRKPVAPLRGTILFEQDVITPLDEPWEATR